MTIFYYLLVTSCLIQTSIIIIISISIFIIIILYKCYIYRVSHRVFPRH